VLAGRENLLAELHALLAEGEKPRTVVLCGLGGVGKSSLAAEYAHRHLADVGVAWQISCENPVVAGQDMAELATQMGGQDIADPRDPIASAHAMLAASVAEWLLIFDNADGETAIRHLLPPAGSGSVLITSQNQHWPGRKVLDVPVLDADVAALFMLNRTGEQDTAAAHELASELGGLPLALDHAAAYIQATGSTLTTYLALFRQRRAALLDRGTSPGHPASVAATIGLALSRLQIEAPDAVGLLRLLACLAPEPVPLERLLGSSLIAAEMGSDVIAVVQPLLGDSIAVGDAVTALRRYSLVTLTGDATVRMHRLVQAVTLDQTPEDLAASWRQSAAALIQAAMPDDPALPLNWPAYAALLPHAQAVLPAESRVRGEIARYLGHNGSFRVACDLLNNLLTAQQDALGSEDPAVLLTLGNLAHWTGRAGDSVGARDMYAELLPLTGRVQGAEHESSLISRNNYALWTLAAGDPAAAAGQLSVLLPVLEQVIGPDDPTTLSARHNLAGCLSETGQPTAAREQFTELLPVRERALGPDHPDTLTTRHNLATSTLSSGDAAAAREQLTKLLPVRERVLGAEHPDTLVTRNSLAAATYAAGDVATALDQLVELIPVLNKVLGRDHEATLNAKRGLAMAMQTHLSGKLFPLAVARDDRPVQPVTRSTL
jgi:tetratricopeptide (TPR) repeat protein